MISILKLILSSVWTEIIMKNTKKDFEDVTPRDFLNLACELEEIKTNLNSKNSIINRTIYMRIYYAVFLFLREWLKKFTQYHSQKGEHAKLPNYIKKQTLLVRK